MAANDYKYSSSQKGQMQTDDGDTAIGNDVNNVWLNTDEKLAQITVDMADTSESASKAREWATQETLVSDPNGDGYSARMWADKDEDSPVDGASAYSSKHYAAKASADATDAASSAATALGAANFEGEWDSVTTYTDPSCVYHNGTYWVQINSSSLNEEPGSSPTAWVLLSGATNDGTNLLLNPQFEVNQEGYYGEAALANDEYGQDMWRAEGASQWTVTSGVVTMLSGTMQQRNNDLAALDGEEATFSLATGSATVYGMGIPADTVVTPGSPVTFTITPGTTNTIHIGLTGEIFSGPKVELGNVATTYRPPLITEEELKCYRYFYRISGLSNSVPIVGFTPSSSLQEVHYSVALPVSMSDSPIISAYTIGQSGGGSSTSSTTFTGLDVKVLNNIVSFVYDRGSTFFSANNTVIMFFPNASSSLTFDARP